MTILMTGATGFIGSHLLKRLLNLKYRIIVFKRPVSNLGRLSNFINKIKFYNIDENTNFDEIFLKNKINIIIHLAAKYSKEDKDQKTKSQMDKINIEIPKKILVSAIKHNVKGFINTGTFFEYSLNTKKPIDEETLIKPYNYYTITKIKFEKILKKLIKDTKIKAVTLKLFSPYGENDNDKIVPLIIKSFIINKKLSLTKGNQKLAFTYVQDVVNAFELAINHIVNEDFNYEVFNIGSNKSYSLKQVVSYIKNISKKSGQIEFGKIHNKKDENLDIHCNSMKAKYKLKWSNKTDLITGLTRTYNFYKRNI